MKMKVRVDSSRTDSLLEDSDMVQQVYYTVPRSLYTGSSSVVSGRQLRNAPVANFTNALTGRLAGLYTLQSSGAPGSDVASLTLRGQTPIIIIDGVVTNLSTVAGGLVTNLFTLSLEEIESVTVLKDALSLAMLGVRGAHGAVVVTTKKGRVEKQQLSFTAQTGIQKPFSWFSPLNAYDYASLRNEALRNDGVDENSGLYYSQAALDAYRSQTDPINYPDVNYRKAITSSQSPFNRYTLSTSGGSPFSKYFISLDHVNQQGLFISPDSLDRYSTSNYMKSYAVRSNIDLNITSKLSAGLNVFGRIQDYNEPGATVNSILNNLQNTPANSYPLINPNGSFAGSQLYQNNLLAQTAAGGYRQRFNRDILVNLYLKGSLDNLLKGLWVRAKVAYNSMLQEEIIRNRSFAVYQQNPTGYTQFGNTGVLANLNGILFQGRMDYQELSIGYDRVVNRHSLNVLLLGNRDNSTNPLFVLDLPYTIIGTSGRIAYNYDERYMIEGAFGFNGSNRYPDHGDTKFGFFPSLGLGWNIEKEEFMQSLSFLNHLKLYTSYGMSGWDNPGYFSYYPRFWDGPSPTFGTGAGTQTSITEGTLANPNISFEKANKFNLGLSGSLLNNGLSFSAEYFNNKYYDLLMQRGTNSTLLGNDYPEENVGENRYFGWDGQLNWQRKVHNVQYFVGVNLSSVGSKVLAMDETTYPFSWMQRTGQPVGRFFGYVAEGLFQNQQEINASAKPIGYLAQPGDIKYRDLNKDGQIDQNDVTGIGSNKPLFFYGVSMGLSWKGFDISALLQGVENRKVYMGGSGYWAFQNNGAGQAYQHNLTRWTPENTNASYPRLSYGANVNNNAASSFWIRSGDYFRLKNAEIGYSLPASVINRIRLENVRVFANGYNLLTEASSELDGRDPEAVSGLGYPLQRVLNFGVNVKF